MRVGVPRKIKNHEYRVGLVPAAVSELVAAGHEVLVETNAGDGINFADKDYVAVSAKILPAAAETFKAAEMIVNLRTKQAMATDPHLAAGLSVTGRGIWHQTSPMRQVEMS